MSFNISLTRAWIVILLAVLSLQLALCQWDPNLDDPQWAKPRKKRTPGADQPWPPWDAPQCPPNLAGYCQLPPYYPYEQIRVEIPNVGIVVGRSMAYQLYRYINLFLGVPYAKPPVYERRFKPPQDPGPNWDMGVRNWDASYYRDACPQELFKYQDRYYTHRNMSEDCLHLNIFAPNLTDRPYWRNTNYPVMVIIPGEGFKNADSMLYPVHLIARKEVLVVTFNYRLGALGFMTTGDDNSPGNYGLLDMIQMLKFIRKYISLFGGDPSHVTLVGHGTGAGAVGLLMLSDLSTFQGTPLFHQAILMSGSDMCEWAYVGDVWNANAVTYTRDLSKLVGCSGDYDQGLPYIVQCLRQKHYEEIVNASASVYKRYGSLAGPFGPVVDRYVLMDTPKNLRDAGKSMKIKIIAGVTRDAGAYIARNLTKDLIGVRMEEGLDPVIFRNLVYDMVSQRAFIRNVHEVVGAIEFEYTFWAKPDNKSAVRQNLIDLWSDQMYGSCVDSFLKSQSLCNPNNPNDLTCAAVYMYEFGHRSEFEVLPFWMGTPHGRDMDYLLGYPFYNETLGNITGIMPEQTDWTYIDKNVSDFMQMMWVNFTKYGNPTPDWTRNISWYQFWKYNLSYLHIAEFSYMDLNFRQNHYAFWKEYYPSINIRRPITTTPQPTPRPRIEYQIATWSLVGAAFITVIVIAALGITLCLRMRAG